jgi:ABC-type antimicrobial peptide transport system permease subunit
LAYAVFYIVSAEIVPAIVGVVRDGKYNQIWEPPSRMVFTPLTQGAPASASVVLRAARRPSEATSALLQTVRSVDSNVALHEVRTMREHLDSGNAFFAFRIGAFVTGLFGTIGVLLAAIGLYGMIAYDVNRRGHEIGVRRALGANSADIIRDVLVRGLRLVSIGIAAGALIAAGLAQLIRSFLLDVSPFDALTYAAVTLLLAAITLLASFVPARRATTVDPLVVLRTE